MGNLPVPIGKLSMKLGIAAFYDQRRFYQVLLHPYLDTNCHEDFEGWIVFAPKVFINGDNCDTASSSDWTWIQRVVIFFYVNTLGVS